MKTLWQGWLGSLSLANKYNKYNKLQGELIWEKET